MKNLDWQMIRWATAAAITMALGNLAIAESIGGLFL